MSPFLGLLLLCLSGIVIYRIIRLIQKARLMRSLKTNGVLVIAKVKDVHKQLRSEKGSWGERMWDLVPHYDVTAQWKDPKTQQLYTFKKTVHGHLPRRYVPGHSVYVLIDPNNPERYYMELSPWKHTNNSDTIHAEPVKRGYKERS